MPSLFMKRLRYELKDLYGYVRTGRFYALIAMMGAGMTLGGITTNAVVVPFGLVSTGLGGTAILLFYILGKEVPLGLIYFILNVPIFLFGWREYPLRPLVISFIGMLMLSGLLEATRDIRFELPQNPILICILGGIMLGIAAGTVVRPGGSGGGQEILAMFLRKKFSVPTATTFNMINGLNLVGALLYANLELLLYSALFMWVFGVVFTQVLTGFSKKRAVQIITSKPEQVAQGLIDRLHRGVTFFNASGAYSGKPIKVVYCIVNLHELGRVKELVFECDEQAFLAVFAMSEAVGGKVSPSISWESEGYRKPMDLIQSPIPVPISEVAVSKSPLRSKRNSDAGSRGKTTKAG